ncbi:hypothetical protein OG401_03935 [Kitasatospora purpeofusca]|uniref:hypothetical protein n=1 Tax=Kitasatospora purpeofusca TaxID=67352 RepID=UPI0022534B35|nr:hypothetical protein [Kitasatospora purpeofusca]MCX4683463.1 hypothetical protein [Kitasatospora purpeofusca]
MTDSATPQDTAAPAEGPVLPEETRGPAVGETHGPADGQAAVAAPEDGERTALRARRRRAAVRWGAAVVVCALAGTGTALAVTAQERTDLPGLATPKDGRYTFPALVLPQLPSGQPAPKENKGRHAADLRTLLLPVPTEAGGSLVAAAAPGAPAPAGSGSASASVSPAAPGSASASPAATPSASSSAPVGPTPVGRVSCEAITADWKDPGTLRALLLQNACRDAAVREWTAADGTRTQIRLLSFGSQAEAWPLFDKLRRTGEPKDSSGGVQTGDTQGWDTVFGVDLATREVPGSPAAGTRIAFLSAGNVTGVITMTNPKGVPTAAFRQVVTLQSDLLA